MGWASMNAKRIDRLVKAEKRRERYRAKHPSARELMRRYRLAKAALAIVGKEILAKDQEFKQTETNETKP